MPTLLVGLTVALMALTGSALAGGQAALRTVRYHGLALRIPRSWPVYRLTAASPTCVRFDRHALYLGTPGAQQSCPADAVGRTEAILVEPVLTRLARASTPGLAGNVTRFTIRAAGVVITGTWRSDRAAIERALGRSRLPRPPRPRRAAVMWRGHGTRARAGSAAYVGKGFDACGAPKPSTMQAWASSSPYHAIGVYIGGANAACPPGSGANPNLNSTWVSEEIAAGWHLIPTYVGLQAPTNSCGCAGITPSQASTQGTAAANDAVADMQSLGLPAGNPIYFDMEYYSPNSTNTSTVLAFLSAWTTQLHADGYASGVYGNSDSAMGDLASQWGTAYPEPDDIWFAEWNNQATATSSSIPTADWSNQQRLHQYQGGHNETYSGTTINIDTDYVDGATAGTTAPPPPAPPPALSVAPLADGTTALTMSWSGGSGLTAWQVLGGDDPSALMALAKATPGGASTRVSLLSSDPYFAVQALGSGGQVLASSGTVTTPKHATIYGRSAFVSLASGVGGLPVGCYTGSPCHVMTTVDSGSTVLARTGTEYVGPNSTGVLFFRLTRSALATLRRARGSSLALRASVVDSAGAAASKALNLVGFSTSGAPPRRWAWPPTGVSVVGMTSFVSSRGIGGVLAACLSPTPCRIATRVSLSGVTLASTGSELIGAHELAYLTYTLNARGSALLRAAGGNQLGVRATLSGPGSSAVAGIALTRF